jgi:glycosyltransferase involved in cell wall biosynthesis
MKDQNLLISVIIPVYNGERFIAEAVDSVLRQRHRPLEIILVDDGSTDSTAQVIREMIAKTDEKMIAIHQPNKGPAAARNRGLEAARGDLIAFLDADDLWTAGMLDGQLQRLIDDCSLQLVVGCTQRVRASDRPESRSRLEILGPQWMSFTLGSALFRRSAFNAVGRFDESLRFGEDVDWFFRARELGVSIGISNEVTRLYRIHENNMTADTHSSDRHFLAALKKSLDRRRVQSGVATDLPAVSGLESLAMKEFELKEIDPGNGEPGRQHS